jgi:hypothetical protein
MECYYLRVSGKRALPLGLITCPSPEKDFVED